MSTALHAALGALLMGGGAWASNLWPGAGLWRGALARLMWWAAPMAAVGAAGGLPPGQAALLGAAAWAGAWAPHCEPPNFRVHAAVLAADLALCLLRNAVVLALPALVLWAAGMFWFEAAKAAASATLCVYAGCALPCRLRGARQGRELGGVLFGAAVGVCVAMAFAIPTSRPDLLP